MSSDSTETSPSVASAPFDQASADVILRASDRVDFRVHSQILAQASSFFATMFSLPQPRPQRSDDELKSGSESDVPASASGTTDDPGTSPDATAKPAPLVMSGSESECALPVVNMSEDGATLDLLLRILYPIPMPTTDVPATLVLAMKAAQKYEMALPEEVVSARLGEIVHTRSAALQVWAAACRAELEDVARLAALALRECDAFYEGYEDRVNSQVALPCMEELGRMDGITAGNYFRLQRFLRRAKQAPVVAEYWKLLAPSHKDDWFAGIRMTMRFSTTIPHPDVLCISESSTQPTFAAHESVLSAHSVVMKHYFAQSNNTTSGTAPKVLALNLPHYTLAALLQICYGDILPWMNLDAIAEMLVAARKYQFREAIRTAQDMWNERATHDPVETFLVAVSHGLKSEANAAAKLVLQSGEFSTVCNTSYSSAMETSSAFAYHRLLQYCDSYRMLVEEQMTAAANTLPACITFPPQESPGVARVATVLDTSSVQAALLYSSGYIGGCLVAEQDCRRTLQDDITRALLYTMDEGGWQNVLKDFMTGTFEILVSLPEKIESEVDKMEFDYEK